MRLHETTRERPVDRFQREHTLLRTLPTVPFDTDELVPAVVNTQARIEFDSNRYSVPPRLAPNGRDSRQPRRSLGAARGPSGGPAYPLLRPETVDRFAGPPAGSDGTRPTGSELRAGASV